MPSAAIDSEATFFAAQDKLAAGDVPAAQALFGAVASAHASDGAEEIICSAAHNGLAELSIDRAVALGFPMVASHESAPVLEARRLLQRALKLWPANAQAAMSLALLERDCGGGKAHGLDGAEAVRVEAVRAPSYI